MFQRMPVIFIGHGSPMNVIETNSYSESLAALGESLPKPGAILVVSAHWLTRGIRVTAAPLPHQIYDFYGFPPELYSVKYQHPGSPDLAKRVMEVLGGDVVLDGVRGIDHAAWAPLCRMSVAVDVPILELSMDPLKSPAYHYQLARKLAPLRREGVLIIGSGNLVHNLSLADFNDMGAPPYEWAVEADAAIEQYLVAKQFDRLINYMDEPWAQYAAPTNDHYLPMLYVLGLADAEETLRFYHYGMQNRSVSMRGFIIGQD